MTGHERIYRHLLRLFPAAFRDRYEEDLVQAFRDQLRLILASDRRSDIVRFWARTGWDLARSAPPEHFRREEPMTRTVEAGSGMVVDQRPPPRLRTGGLVVAFGPVWFALFTAVVARGSVEPLFETGAPVAGISLGLLIVAATVLLTIGGILAVRAARSIAGVVLPLLFLTIPALVLLVLGPALVLIALNSGA